MSNHEYKFPDDFLWGTATSAHQIEGYNENSDWWEYENNKKPNQKYPLEPSNEACDSWNRFEEDFDLCKELNSGAVRISIEWAKIEPREGEFDQEVLNHYKKVLEAARNRGLKTFVTLHHFTTPLWLSDRGLWEYWGTPNLFARYAEKCAQELGDLVDSFITINEPQIYTLVGYIIGNWVPGRNKSYLKSFFVQFNFIRAHRKAYDAIKSVKPKMDVGIVKQITFFETREGESISIDRLACKILNFMSRDLFLLFLKDKLDFIGLNYYFTARLIKLRFKNPEDYVSDLGWWINPGGIGGVLTRLYKDFGLPIYITENGLADAWDKYRKQFIRDHLLSVHSAIRDGADVRGYFHWSLLDNYEWHEGYWPKFGLVEIDRENNLERKPRPSFYYYADIAKKNAVILESGELSNLNRE